MAKFPTAEANCLTLLNTADCMVSQLESAVSWAQSRVIEGVSVEIGLWDVLVAN